MKLDTTEDVYEVLYNCMGNYTIGNKELLFKCIQRAQFLKDLDLEFAVRQEHLSQLVFLEYYEDAIPMYPWLLNQCDKDPDRFDYFGILWAYKWIMDCVYNFASISSEQIEELFKDFEKRLNDYGASDKLVPQYKMRKALNMGHPEVALALYKAMDSFEQDELLDDCDACQVNNSLDTLVANKMYAEVYEAADIIIRGELSCHNVPHSTLPKLAYSLMHENKWEQAEIHIQRAIQKLNKGELNLDSFNVVILYLAHEQRFVTAADIIRKQCNLITTRTSNRSKALFYQSCYCLFFAMEKASKKSVNITLSNPAAAEELDFYNDDVKTYKTSELVMWFKNKADLNAKALDIRNKNNYYVNLLKEDFRLVFD